MGKDFLKSEIIRGGVASDGISNTLVKCAPDMKPLILSDKYNTKILLVRHGESLGNATHSFLGHTDKDLSARGYLQAERTAELLAYTHIDKIYASDLKRAFNTGVMIAKRHNLEVEADPSLRELFVGEWEGMNVSDIDEKYPDLMKTWRTDFGNIRCPRGESAAELQDRIFKEVLRLAELNVGKTILLAFHAAAIRMLWGRLLGVGRNELNDAVPFSYNASVSVVYFDGEKLIPGEYSHMTHLTDI